MTRTTEGPVSSFAATETEPPVGCWTPATMRASVDGPGLLGLELPGELGRSHGRSPLRHRNQSTFLELAMSGGRSPATE
ncbi:hypothetical protein I3W98_16020 [Streptomyces cavourensis]|nr:hypothetical protein [Streptomyces cavourensis]